MTEVQVIRRMSIRPGTLERFKRQVADCVRLAASKDIGILRYDWLISRDGTTCEVREAYSDSDALLLHRANVADAMDTLLNEFVDQHVTTAYGEPSPQLVRLADILGPSVTWYSLFDGLSRRYPARIGATGVSN